MAVISDAMLKVINDIKDSGLVPFKDVDIDYWPSSDVVVRISCSDGFYLRISDNEGDDKKDKPLYFRDTGDVYSGGFLDLRDWIDRHYAVIDAYEIPYSEKVTHIYRVAAKSREEAVKALEQEINSGKILSPSNYTKSDDRDISPDAVKVPKGKCDLIVEEFDFNEEKQSNDKS